MAAMATSVRALVTQPEEKPATHHIAYAMATAVATQLPLAWIASRARARLLRRALGAIAARHEVIVPRDALDILSRVSPKQLPFAGRQLAFTRVPIIGRAARWAALPIMAADATDLFARLVLFETYCTDLHTGVAIHPILATRIHDTIGVTIADIPPQIMKSAVARTKAALHARADSLGAALRHVPGLGRFTGGTADHDAVVPEAVDVEPLDADTQQVLENQNRILRLLHATSKQLTEYKSTFENFLGESFRVRWKRDE